MNIEQLKIKIKKIIGSMRFVMVSTYLVVIIAALGMLTIYTVNMLDANLYSSEKASTFAKANMIAQTLSEVWTTDTAVSREKFAIPVNNCLAGTNIRGIVVDNAYKVLYDTSRDSQMSGKVFIRDVLQKSLDGEQAVIVSDKEAENKMMSVAVPIEKDDKIIGGVYLAASVDGIDTTVASAQTSLIVFSVLTVILIGMLSLGLSSIIALPMAEFRETAQRISKGDFSARVKVSGQNEMVQMGETMNFMASELELLEDKRRKFVSDVSHELKTPMTGIKLICDTCETIDDPEMQKEFIGDISSEVDRLSRLVEKLLTLSRLDDGKVKRELVDIKSMLTKIVRNLNPVAQKNDIGIYIDFKFETYPELFIDYDKIYEAFYNIADNAIKYSPSDGYLHISVDCDTDKLTVCFEDNGPGIPENEREKIFERFYRLDDSRARDTGGTGLGLAIANEAITMHGGGISVGVPENGIGSVFTVVLPVRTNEEVVI